MQNIIDFLWFRKQKEFQCEIKLSYGEPIQLEGFKNLNNKVNRSVNLILVILRAPFLVFISNWNYLIPNLIALILVKAIEEENTQIICKNYKKRIFTAMAFIVPFLILTMMQLVVEIRCYNTIKRLDSEINQMETTVIKTWNECISNEDLLKKVQDKAHKQGRNPEERSLKETRPRLQSKTNQANAALNKRTSRLQFQSSKSNFSRQFSARPKESVSSRRSQLSPLIKEDKQLKQESVQKIEETPEVRRIKQQLPTLFQTNRPRNNKSFHSKLFLDEQQQDDSLTFTKLIPSSQIKIGDLIVLNQNEIALCDILVINCSDTQFLIDDLLCEYSLGSVRSPVLYNKIDVENLGYFKRNLAAQIMIKQKNKGFTGFVQLKNDPHSESLSMNNMIMRKQKLLKTHWIIGIAFRVGNECLSQQETNYKSSDTKMLNKLTYCYWIFLLLTIIFQLVTIYQKILSQIQYVYITNTKFQQMQAGLLLINSCQMLLNFPYLFKVLFYLTNLIINRILHISNLAYQFKLCQQLTIDQYNEAEIISFKADDLIENKIDFESFIIDDQEYKVTEQLLQQAITDQKTQPQEIKKMESMEGDNRSQKSQRSNKSIKSGADSIGSNYNIYEKKEINSDVDSNHSMQQQIRLPEMLEFKFMGDYNGQSKPHEYDNIKVLHSNDQLNTDVQVQQLPLIYQGKLDMKRSSKQLRGSKQMEKSIAIKHNVKLDNKDLVRVMFKHQVPYNIQLLQLVLNHMTWSKILRTERYTKIKNYSMNALDHKQVKFAKMFGYEFITINYVQNNQEYVIKIFDQIYGFKMIDMQIAFKKQSLIQVFELPEAFQLADQKYIFMQRQSDHQGFQKSLQDEQKRSNYNSNIDQKPLYQIKYSYCILNKEDGEQFIEKLQGFNLEDQDEEVQFNLITAEIFKINVIIGINYTPLPNCQELMYQINRSNKQILLHTKQSFVKALSVSVVCKVIARNDIILLFSQQTEEDLRAFMKKGLQDFISLFGPVGLKNSLTQIISKSKTQQLPQQEITSQKLLSEPSSEDSSYKRSLSIVVNYNSFQIIKNSKYLLNHLNLLCKYAKAIILTEFDNDQIREFYDHIPQQNILQVLKKDSENVDIKQNQQMLQLLDLQEFLPPVDIQNPIDKHKFFANCVKLLKYRIQQDKRFFNQIYIMANSDCILNSFKDLKQLIFQISPLYRYFFQIMLENTFRRTLILLIVIQATQYESNLQIITNFEFFHEIIYFSIIYQVFIYIVSMIHFFSTLMDKENQMAIRNYIESQFRNNLQYLINIIQYGLVGVICFCIAFDPLGTDYTINIAWPFLIMLINDMFNIIYLIKSKLVYIIVTFYFTFYIIYILNTQTYNYQDLQYIINIQIVFEIIGLSLIALLVDLVVDCFLSNRVGLNEFQRDIDSQFLHDGNYYEQSNPITLENLEKNVYQIFHNLDNADFQIQKLLSSSLVKKESNFRKWQQETFQKANSILKWAHRIKLQILTALFVISNYYWSIYQQDNENIFEFVLYIIFVTLDLLILIFVLIKKLNSQGMTYLVYFQYLIKNFLVLIILIGQTFFDEKIYFLTLFLINQLYNKFFPIYDNRLYIIITLILVFQQSIQYIIENSYQISAIVQVVSGIILFSSQQYISKNYLTFLEEDQATNQINFFVESGRINDTLSILLPKFIRNRLNETVEYNFLQNQGEVAIVFCDICQFDSIIMEEKENIITFLDDIFRQFDKLCHSCGVQKIETVGKTYMASAGLRACEQELNYLVSIDPVQRAVNIAQQMMEYMNSKTWGKDKQPLIGKIGIHYGRAISGVIGHHKPQFSLIGDTVNTTSRVCSTGEDGQVTLSEKAFQQLKSDKYAFRQRMVEMKGLGMKPTFILQKKINTQIMDENIVRRTSGMTRKSIFKKGLTSENQIQRNKKVKRTLFMRVEQPGSNNMIKAYQMSSQNFEPMIERSEDDSQEQRDKKNSGSIKLNQQNQQNQLSQVTIHQRNHKETILKVTTGNYDLQFEENLRNQLNHPVQIIVYNPEIKKNIDYNLLLNVLMLKSQLNTNNLQGEVSFLQLVPIPFMVKDPKLLIVQEQYQETVGTNSNTVNNSTQKIFLLYYFIKQFCLIELFNDINSVIFILQWLILLVLGTKEYLNHQKYRSRFLKYEFVLLQFFYGFINILSGVKLVIDDKPQFVNFEIIEFILIQSVFCSIQLYNFYVRIGFCLISGVYGIIVSSFSIYPWMAFYIIISTIYNIVYTYYVEDQQISCFKQKQINNQQQLKESQLVKYLLPSHVLGPFLNGEHRSKKSDQIDNLTILFADIAGFTEYSSQVTPEQVLDMLKNLFVEFDQKALEFNVYKLYTIGDCYVVIGMIDINNRDIVEEARNVVELGFAMIDIIAAVRRQIGFDGLNMRIGIHTGSVIGGVMGTDIVRYDIYGPDVLIANKMESNGKKGNIQVSQTTKDLLDSQFSDDYAYEMHTTVHLTSIQREIKGYIIEKLTQDEMNQEE